MQQVNITANPVGDIGIVPVPVPSAAKTYSAVPTFCAERAVPDQIVPTNQDAYAHSHALPTHLTVGTSYPVRVEFTILLELTLKEPGEGGQNDRPQKPY